MIVVVDKKVVKHLVETGGGLLEIPIRVKYEYSLQDRRFVDGSMKRELLYNRKAVRKHFPQIDSAELDRDINATVDQSLEECLRYQGHASGDVDLYPGVDSPAEPEDVPPPKLILPGDM